MPGYYFKLDHDNFHDLSKFINYPSIQRCKVSDIDSVVKYTTNKITNK